MAWVKFNEDFEWRQPSFSVDYKAGWTGLVKAQCADAAVAAGKAERVKTPRRDEEPAVFLAEAFNEETS